jgi:hypothetical protein
MTAAEVEISEDLFVITAEEAKKNVENPKLTSLVIQPAQTRIEPKKKTIFQANGIDQFGRTMPVEKVHWSATGGTIADDGVFAAGEDEGSFVVKAKAGTIEASTSIFIAKTGSASSKTAGKQLGFKWTGEIPSQKWMNFYTKVLSKHVGSGALKLTVSVEVNPEGGLSEQRVQEAKAALRELGLADDVQVE